MSGFVHMSAEAVDSESSESSSGYEDGLGRRALAFDRETGGMLERLVLRPEMAAFERALRDRMAVVASLEDERFTVPRAIERDGDDRLIVVSECVGGRRLADLIDSAGDHGIVAGLDAGLGLLLELLPALSRLHDAGIVHGTLAPGRVIVTPAGQVVLLDAIYGEALERLQLTRRRLWSEFRLAFPPTAGIARFDKSADLTHAAMIAASLTVGRPLRDEEYPEGLPTLRQEILEIASIRGSKSFAEAVDTFFASLLPLAGRRTARASADEAAIDLRKLIRKELGITTCRAALLDFISQVQTADGERAAAEAEATRVAVERHAAEQTERERAERERAEQARIEAERIERERVAAERREQERLEAERRERERLEAEQVERERAEAERRDRERLEAQRKEQARAEAERKERERVERERAEAERKERERVEAERKERERAEAERREAERLAAERRERERLEAERKERERLERERQEAQRRERERLEAERRERERIEAERKERERLERERLEAERKERERLEAERKERERLEAERKKREEAERKERERLEAERKERERLEAERKERERLEAERKKREEAEKKERERLEAERKERERLEAERKERERLEAEKKERERQEAERKKREEAERKERERQEAERKKREEAERKERERLEADRKKREEAERREQERLEAERQERERQAELKKREEAERKERERVERERAEAERREQERLEAERKERERQEAERKEAERKERERLEAERKERERQEAERRERERVAAAETPSSSGWLVPPDRANSFEPVAPDAQAQRSNAPRAYPIYHPPAEPGAWTAALPPEPPAVEIAPVAAVKPTPVPLAPPAPPPSISVAPAPIRLKDSKPISIAPAAPRVETRREREPEPLAPIEPYVPDTGRETARTIPWKLVAAGVVLVIGVVGVAKTFKSSPVQPLLNKVVKSTPAPAPVDPPVKAVPKNAGRVTITTNPPGARVLIDGKAAGESPLTLEPVPPGRHTFTMIGDNITAKRTLRVEAGKAMAIDMELFSGFAAISSPILLEISENGKVLGTSAEAIILSPGRHDVRLANKELGYAVTQPIDVQAGETTHVNVDPRGTANINAAPWAEVFVDGEKVGETPLANIAIRLGVREIVFRNPQFPDRKVVVTVTTTATANVSVDFNK